MRYHLRPIAQVSLFHSETCCFMGDFSWGDQHTDVHTLTPNCEPQTDQSTYSIKVQLGKQISLLGLFPGVGGELPKEVEVTQRWLHPQS